MQHQHQMGKKEFVRKAVAIQAEFLDNKLSQSPHAKAAAMAALDRFRLMGRTAAYFGHHQAMHDLSEAIETAGGDRYWTNQMWHGIDGWSPLWQGQ